MSKDFDLLEHADIEFDERGRPRHKTFDDVYFSAESGIEESRHVFINGNDLCARWQALPRDKPGQFILAETGFGTGLNFLLSWSLWRQFAPPNWSLHFLSVEKHPLRRADFVRCARLWPQLDELSEQLLRHYPHTTPGFHRLQVDEQVRLTLMLGDATAMFSELLATDAQGLCQQLRPFVVDAWFLDGFTPSKNPNLWNDALFDLIAKLSDEGTSLASFSVAGAVKRGLKKVGFVIEKRRGFARKREMLRAGNLSPRPTPFKFRLSSPHATPWQVVVPKTVSTRQAVVVGAGLAGCHVAHALARRGWQVRVIDRHAEVASEASGNPQGVLFTKLSPKHAPLSDFMLASFLYASRFYQHLLKGDTGCHLLGMLQLAHDAKERALQESLFEVLRHYPELARRVDATQTRDLSGLKLATGGLYWPDSGWINPKTLCRALLTHDNIRFIGGQEVGSLVKEQGLWRVGNHQAPVVVMACAKGLRDFPLFSSLPIKAIKGQVSLWAGDACSQQLKIPVCAEGYLSPLQEGLHCVGASYNLGKKAGLSEEENHQLNAEKLKSFGLEAGVNDTLQARVNFRMATPDYLPFVGPVPDFDEFAKPFASLAKNAKAFIDSPGQYHEGQFVATGFGSRGLSYTPLCAEYLAALINHEPLPISQSMAKHLSAARFLIRALSRPHK